MTDSAYHISVCICTYKRPQFLRRLLEEINKQETQGQFTYSIVVVDNDHAQSAKPVVTKFAERSAVTAEYFVQPQQNIALARNTAISNARGDFVAFIDDDEFPCTGWLCSLLNTFAARAVDGVLGPVKPVFEQDPPKWLLRGGFYERPAHETGYRIGLADARTGNVLFRRKMFAGVKEPFRVEFGTGGEDADFFRRMMERGCVFLWCNEAVVYEIVPVSRCRRSYLLRRALLRGRNSLKYPTGTTHMLVKSCIAALVYALVLPFLFVIGPHHFMVYLVKFCDHAGRLLAFMGLNPVKRRDL